ncbi:MAG: 1-(5-phosphoribosyl)-5-[(5-phosphoribosylamino)methylideneamino]imidazole-4-carboxamide isomerase [Proteobacteria bacterium]|jgi:phosphoribosylformimino-5-aminoimidazole carboxamide ribotide isomerase|nr:1-(5-phosphoribosyl)-5-[(5-phosphoribosylamino)methylideneamino]imidazole-4-carboxamide isomerase [Pseudomonadota bacterium]MDA0872814.1 1-(5-phosphoribosyl)-5-[(5-phosphoribosylamino)methylideneamino]imidazole-4-carboxamide isomerase [Pseudomonadota bacterium]MDA1133769.1 1-(5-phosphoribosyl)-5-[(5-phosphoribosylamino)methylideneamino]imidazole-4-carboxamide isomerase [Pseudomonadota bacterium]
MLIIPAIDLKEGKCVRLKQGLMDQSTVFSEHPAEMAKKWFLSGARRLHLVDLDGAFSGKPMNLSAIKEIISELGQQIPIQLGGGIRSLETIEKFLDSGLDSVIIGTAAITQPGFLHEACYAFPGQIMVGLDAKDGDVAINGWSKLTGHNVIDLAQKFEEYGVESIIYTDIGRDGMLTGVNIDATVKLTEAVSIPVVASGGVSDLKDIEALCEVSNIGIRGVITGRAIYEGTLNFEAAQQLADKLTQPL